MAIQLVAAAASQLINTNTTLTVPVQQPAALAVAAGNGFSVNVWINANWGSTTTPRGTKSFVGIYGPPSRTAGFAAYYYTGKLVEPPVVVRVDSSVNNTYVANQFPVPGQSYTYSMRWTGYLNVPTTSNFWYFRTTSDDGVRLYVNGNLVIDNWTDHSSAVNTTTVAIPLTVGTEVPIVLEYYNSITDGVIKLEYGIGTSGGAPAAGSAAWTVIPQTAVSTSAPLNQTYIGMQIGALTGSGEITCWGYGGTALITTPTNYAVTNGLNNNWVNLCYTWDGTNNRLYINGKLVATTATAVIPGNLKYITINGYLAGGAAETDNHYVDAYLLYNRPLLADEVLTIYNADGARHGIWNGLIANYEFDEGVNGANVTSVMDLSGGGSNLLMTGAGANPKYSYTNSHADSNIRPPVST